ncbi:hypothetical protein EVA_13932 [gut metagenome]|uniref:Uncharacterized protein n=1 Tax=gut metagenome TaxID=749906 RepID=J9G846_9ZZZZ
MLPSAPHWGHVPAAVRRFVRFPDESRHSHSCSKHRYSHSHSTHRHSHSHCCTRDRPHGLSGSSTNYKGTYFKAKEIYNAQKNNHNRAAKAPPNTVNPQSIQSQQLPCCLSFSSKQEAATALAYRATTGCIPNKPIRNPPNRCFHRLLSLKKSITVPITILSLILKKFDRLRRYLNTF